MCEGGARRALGPGPAGEDDDQAGVRLSETLHLRRRLGLCLRGVRLGPAWAQARTGKNPPEAPTCRQVPARSNSLLTMATNMDVLIYGSS